MFGLLLIVSLTFLSLKAGESYLSQKEFAKIREVIANETEEVTPSGISKIKNRLNPDIYGWLEIDVISLSLPVMYRTGDSSYYLNHNYEGKIRNSGSLFIAGECFEGCDNLIIYGHKMNDGSMFGSLETFLNQDLIKMNPKLKLITDRNENGTYVLRSVILSKIKNDFDYYDYVDLRDKDLRDSYISWCQRESIFPCQFNKGSLITLSTCSYHQSDGRLILVFEKE